MYFRLYEWRHICSYAKVARRGRLAEAQCTRSLGLGYRMFTSSLPPGLWLTSHAVWLPRIGISSGTLRSVIEYGLPVYRNIFSKLGAWITLAVDGGAGKSVAALFRVETVPVSVDALENYHTNTAGLHCRGNNDYQSVNQSMNQAVYCYIAAWRLDYTVRQIKRNHSRCKSFKE